MHGPHLPAPGFFRTVTVTKNITDYTYGLGLLSQRTTVSRFYRWDGIGSLRNLEDSSRNVVASSVFDAYGLQQNAVTLASAYGFIGEEGVRGEKGQAATTLVPYHMRARMYDPLTGRFTSRDPIWDKNLYQYANGNPWSYTDATGDAARRPAHGRSALASGSLSPLLMALDDAAEQEQVDRFIVTRISQHLSSADRRRSHEVYVSVLARAAMDGEGHEDAMDEALAAERAYLIGRGYHLARPPEIADRGRAEAVFGPGGCYLAFSAADEAFRQAAGAARNNLEILALLPIPIVGQAASAAAGAIAIYQGDYGGAVWDLVGIIPVEAIAKSLGGVTTRIAAHLVETRLGQRVLEAVAEGTSRGREIVGAMAKGVSKKLSKAQLAKRAGTAFVKIIGGDSRAEGEVRRGIRTQTKGPRKPGYETLDQQFGSRAEAQNAALKHGQIPENLKPYRHLEVSNDPKITSQRPEGRVFSTDTGRIGHYWEYRWKDASGSYRRVIVEHIADKNVGQPHFHAGDISHVSGEFHPINDTYAAILPRRHFRYPGKIP